jgi:GNAT superfamily N-acetyltransferase
VGAAPVTIRAYQPGDLGRLATLNVVYHTTEWDFPGPFFEAKIAAGMAAFLETLAAPGNGWWSAELDGDYVGGIVIDGNNAAAAQLRWFILSDKARGQGLGRQLLDTAMNHCRARGFPLVFLSTFRGLDTARALYERAGFRLVHESEDTTWGTPKTEQRFEWTPQDAAT